MLREQSLAWWALTGGGGYDRWLQPIGCPSAEWVSSLDSRAFWRSSSRLVVESSMAFGCAVDGYVGVTDDQDGLRS